MAGEEEMVGAGTVGTGEAFVIVKMFEAEFSLVVVVGTASIRDRLLGMFSFTSDLSAASACFADVCMLVSSSAWGDADKLVLLDVFMAFLGETSTQMKFLKFKRKDCWTHYMSVNFIWKKT